MPYYRVKHKATGRTEIVEAGDRRTARNAVAMDAFEVEIATAEDGFRLAKENREIIVAGAVKDPDQPGLPLDPIPALDQPSLSGRLAALGLDIPESEIAGWRAEDMRAVREFLDDLMPQGVLPAVLGPYLSDRADKVEEATAEAAKKLEESGLVGAVKAPDENPFPGADEAAAEPEERAVDARLLVLALAELEIRVTEAIVSGWAEEERGAAWAFANASAVAGDMGGPELPDFLRIYTAAGLAGGAR